MSRLIVILLPILVAVGATVVALRLPVTGSEEQRFKKLVAGACAVGLLLSILSYWSIGGIDPSARIASIQQAVEENTKKVTADVSGQYEQKIAVLNTQILDLQRRIGNQSDKIEVSQETEGSAGGPRSGSPAPYWTQTTLREGDSGELEVRFKIYAPLNIPAFVAICDQPCRAERAQAGDGSEGASLAGSTSKNVAGYVFKKPRPMPAGTEGFLILRGPGKGGFKVTEFRALDESEVPDNMK